MYLTVIVAVIKDINYISSAGAASRLSFIDSLVAALVSPVIKY